MNISSDGILLIIGGSSRPSARHAPDCPPPIDSVPRTACNATLLPYALGGRSKVLGARETLSGPDQIANFAGVKTPTFSRGMACAANFGLMQVSMACLQIEDVICG
jgi:hypothetical protein